MFKHIEVCCFYFACLYVVLEINHCGDPTVTCLGGQRCCSSMAASRATFVQEFFNEFSRLLHADTVKEFRDLIFLRPHVPRERRPTDVCVEDRASWSALEAEAAGIEGVALDDVYKLGTNC